jgi:hypothetical protein
MTSILQESLNEMNDEVVKVAGRGCTIFHLQFNTPIPDVPVGGVAKRVGGSLTQRHQVSKSRRV